MGIYNDTGPELTIRSPISDLVVYAKKMAISRANLSEVLILIASIAFAQVVQVLCQAETSLPCSNIPVLTGGTFKPDEAIEPVHQDRIMRALNSGSPGLDLWRLNAEWEKTLKNIEKAKPKWYSPRRLANDHGDKQEKRKLQVALTYLHYHRTQSLIADGDLTSALNTFKHARLLREKSPGVAKTDMDALGADLRQRIQRSCGGA